MNLVESLELCFEPGGKANQTGFIKQ